MLDTQSYDPIRALGDRGQYPCFFPCRLSWDRVRELTNIPGVIRGPGGLRCTWDAAWVLGALLDQTPPVPPTEAFVNLAEDAKRMPGLQRYLQLGLNKKLRPYQKEGALFLARRMWAMNCDPMRCLSGDTEITINRAGNAKRIRLSQLEYKFNGGEAVNGKTWDSTIPTFAQSCTEDGFIRLNQIKSVQFTGTKTTLRVVTDDGHELRATPEHQFMTNKGWARLAELREGDAVLVACKPKKQNQPYAHHGYPALDGMWNHPHAVVFTSSRKDGRKERLARVTLHRLVAEAKHNGLTVAEFVGRVVLNEVGGLQFLDPEKTIVHHKDGNKFNNDPANLDLLTREEHSRQHGVESAWKNCSLFAEETRIARIDNPREEMTYDVTMAAPYHNYAANGIVVHNSGKSVQALAGAILVDAQKVLIVCPALAKYVWAEEISKWLNDGALILEGRSGRYARGYCVGCEARGRVLNETTGKFERCEACKLKNGQANGFTIFRDAEVHQAIARSQFVIVNYDLLVAQKSADEAGKTFTRDDLQGWCPMLAQHSFDVCIADESHLLRGWSSDPKKKGQTRRERFVQCVANIPRVWGLTGTPIYGFVRDLWGQIDALSGGLYGNGSGLPFSFHTRFCGGHKDEYGWKADGRTALADTELPKRLEFFKIQRPRSVILSQQPAKIRQVIRIDEDQKTKSAARRAARTGSTSEGKLTRLLAQTSKTKRSAIVDNLINEMAQGNKVIAFTLLRKSAEQLGKALEAACKKADVRARMRAVDTRIWMTHGDTTPKGRFQMARAYRDHAGAAAFVATIDAVQVAISLKGAASVHFADMHWQPAAMLQAEDRPYEVGIPGLAIVYYVVRGSIDEHVEATVLPKIETLAKVVNEKGAGEMQRALSGPNESMKQIFARLAAHVPETEEEDDWIDWDDDD